MNLRLIAGLWSVTFLSFLGVAVMRWSIGRNEDDHIHALDSETIVRTQSAMAHRLDVLDRWKTILLVAVLVLGLVLGGFYLYGVWLDGLTTHY